MPSMRGIPTRTCQGGNEGRLDRSRHDHSGRTRDRLFCRTLLLRDDQYQPDVSIWIGVAVASLVALGMSWVIAAAINESTVKRRWTPKGHRKKGEIKGSRGLPKLGRWPVHDYERLLLERLGQGKRQEMR